MAVATVDEYLTSMPADLQEIGATLRPLIDAALTHAQCTMWHGQPVWMVGKTPVAMLKAYPNYLTFALFRGRAIADASGRLEAGSREMASVKLKSVDDVDAALFTAWLRDAEALELA